MAITNNKLKALIKESSQTLQGSVNALEKEVLKNEEEFDKPKVAFLVSKVNSDFEKLHFYLKENGAL